MDIVPYVLLLLMLGVDLCINTRRSNNFMFFVLFVFSAIRYDVGFDYPGYIETIVSGSDWAINRFELGQKWLVLLSRQLFPQFFFIANSFIAIYFTRKAILRMSCDVSLAALTFLSFPLLYLHSFSIVRFWSALAIIVYASTLLQDKRYCFFSFLILVALCFHKGAIVGLLFIPLYLVRIPVWLNIAILCTSFVSGEFVLSQILSNNLPDNMFIERLVNYAESGQGSDGMRKIPYIFLFFDLILLIRLRRYALTDSTNYRNFTIYNIGVALMFLFGFQTTLSVRLSSPFICYLYALIPFVVKFKSTNVQFKDRIIYMLVYWVFCSSLFLYNVNIINSSLGRSQYLPYKIFFMQ